MQSPSECFLYVKTFSYICRVARLMPKIFIWIQFLLFYHDLNSITQTGNTHAFFWSDGVSPLRITSIVRFLAIFSIWPRRTRNYPKGGDKFVPTLLQSRFLDKTLPGKPNRVLPKYKVAFKVNGFWARAQRPKVCYTAYYPHLQILL